MGILEKKGGKKSESKSESELENLVKSKVCKFIINKCVYNLRKNNRQCHNLKLKTFQSRIKISY